MIDNTDAASRPLALASRHVGVSLSTFLEDDDIQAWFRCGEWPYDVEPHLRALLDETDTATLLDLVIAGGASYASLARCADQLLPDGHDTRRWLDDRRAF